MSQSSQCITCRYYRGLFKCSAYPERIPQEVLDGTVSHRTPYQGDNGVTWMPAVEEAILKPTPEPESESEEEGETEK